MSFQKRDEEEWKKCKGSVKGGDFTDNTEHLLKA